MANPLYPLFLNLAGRDCVVVGGGDVAEAKVRDLLDAGANLRVIAPAVTNTITEWARTKRLRWDERGFESGDLRGAYLVVSAMDRATNAKVFAEAEATRIFCNAVDDVENCSCYAGAVVRRGPLQIAISTAGKSPALAQRLRKELEEQFVPEYGPWVEHLGEVRNQVLQDAQANAETKRQRLHEQASAAGFEEFRRSKTAGNTSRTADEKS
jgi:precorrin-2 dehydrogenase/sirohydrochlorin ferrochelatase